MESAELDREASNGKFDIVYKSAEQWFSDTILYKTIVEKLQ